MKPIDLDILGIDPQETKVYLTMLAVGSAHVSTIAKKANLPRVNCYYILEKLAKKKLVKAHMRKGLKIFSPEPPEVIVNGITEQLSYAREVLPELIKYKNALALRPAIQFYDGYKEMYRVLEQSLVSNTQVLGYSNLEKVAQEMPNDIKGIYLQRAKKGIKTRLISPYSQAGIDFVSNIPTIFRTSIEIMFINPDEFFFEYETLIFEDKVVTASTSKSEVISMTFTSAQYSESQRAIFNLAWLGATRFIAS